jgi:hypothetical protein
MAVPIVFHLVPTLAKQRRHQILYVINSNQSTRPSEILAISVVVGKGGWLLIMKNQSSQISGVDDL